MASCRSIFNLFLENRPTWIFSNVETESNNKCYNKMLLATILKQTFADRELVETGMHILLAEIKEG